MSTTFSGDVGYRGVVKLNEKTVLATGGNINIAHNTINASGVWGAGYQNAAEVVAYANNYLQLDGSFDCEVTAGSVFDEIKAFAFTNRGSATGTKLAILPTGENGFVGKVWCTSLSFNSSQDQVLTSSMDWNSYINSLESTNAVTVSEGSISIDYSNNVIVPGSCTNSALGVSNGTAIGDTGDFQFNGLYPYWANEIYTGAVSGSGTTFTVKNDIMDWQCQYSSSAEFLKCCGAGTALKDNVSDAGLNAPVAPDYIVLGSMTADGSFTVFKIAGDFDPNSYHTQKALKFVVKSPADTTGHTILLPKVVISQGGTSLQSGSSFITANFSFTGIGDGKNPPMSLDPAQ